MPPSLRLASAPSRRHRSHLPGLGLVLVGALAVAVALPAAQSRTAQQSTVVATPALAAATPVGSAAVGSARYAVPSGALYVKPGGGGGSGTASSPYAGINTAIAKARSGATLVLRGGTYHEKVNVPADKRLTIQNYPGEAAWLDGSSTVTGWVQSGYRWVKSGWNTFFDHRASFTAGQDQTSRFVEPAYPMAAYPDQVWVNGARLTQVGSESKVTTGTFYVDQGAKRLVIGTNPSGKSVQASTLEKGIKVQSAGTVLRGFGVRRYANSVASGGAVQLSGASNSLENIVTTQNATIGLTCGQNAQRLNRVSVTDSGMLGLSCTKATNLVVSQSDISGNNLERFKRAPASGGLKITTSEGVTVRQSRVSNNYTIGIWFDASTHDMHILSNTVRNNGATGIVVEISELATIADNYVSGSGRSGIMIMNTGNVGVWNNTLDRNARSITFWQDHRRPSSATTAAKTPWVTRNVTLRNNVVAYGTDFCPILSQDELNKMYGKDFGVNSNNGLYYRTSKSSPSRFACWANGTAGTKSYYDLTSWRSATGLDGSSQLQEGAAVLDGTSQLTAAARSTAGGVPTGLTSSIASQIGRTTGEKRLGPFTTPLG